MRPFAELKTPKLQQNFIILSGGLGSSAYIRERMQRQLMAVPHPNATHAAVVPCQDPQLVVVRGLLLDHQQRMETGNLSVLATRVARASYGVVVKEAYSPAQDFNEDVVEDPFDSKKRWAINQIQWLIRKVPSSVTAEMGLPEYMGTYMLPETLTADRVITLTQTGHSSNLSSSTFQKRILRGAGTQKSSSPLTRHRPCPAA